MERENSSNNYSNNANRNERIVAKTANYGNSRPTPYWKKLHEKFLLHEMEQRTSTMVD